MARTTRATPAKPCICKCAVHPSRSIAPCSFFLQQSRLPHRRQVIALHVRQRFAHNRISRDQHQVRSVYDSMLVQTKRFTQKPPRSRPYHRRSNFAAGNNPQTRTRRRSFHPIQGKATDRNTPSIKLCSLKIPVLPDALCLAQTQRTGRRIHQSSAHGSKTFAANAAAVLQNGASALRRVAAAKAVLTFAANLRWLILAFHKICRSAALRRGPAARKSAQPYQ